MCAGPEHGSTATAVSVGGTRVVAVDDLMSYAREVCHQAEVRRTAPGFVGYGSTKPGDRALIAVDTHYDPQVVDAVSRGLREMGASVDVITVEVEPDREFTTRDEIDVIMRREPWTKKPRRWEGLPWVEELALREGYQLLVHGKGGGIPNVPHRYEAIPWLQVEHFASEATIYPRDLHTLVNLTTWNAFFGTGRGGRVRVTDPEGTDLSYTLLPEYFDGTRRGYTETPWWGHILGHGPTPILPHEDASGIVCGTTSHFQRPFPRIRLTLEKGRLEKIEGGGDYGAAWRELKDESDGTQYPCFPRPGLFWLWEVAIGTNPKIARPHNIQMLSSGGFEWERRRSGIIHIGLGTRWRGPEEVWAGERGLLYGHLHAHLFFPTLVIEPPTGKEIVVIDKGHLTALDDPKVRDLAATYGDPDRILSDPWKPHIPGIDAPGSYEEYAKEPWRFIYQTRVGSA
jgi:hypothetical protein